MADPSPTSPDDQLVEERLAGFRLAMHELSYHARKDSTGDETKVAFHIAVNWLAKRAEELGAEALVSERAKALAQREAAK